MPTYRFEPSTSVVGPDEFDALEGAERAQLLETARTAFEMAACEVPSDFCRVQAEAMDDEPETIECSFWGVFEGDATTATFDLLYFSWCDGGVLFHAGGARPAGARLWPHGFVKEGGGDAALDVEALSVGLRAAIAEGVAKGRAGAGVA